MSSSKRVLRLSDEAAAALRRDDEEIEALEVKLGISNPYRNSKRKQQSSHKDPQSNRNRIKLHKEYAKLEGYGEDFGEFLDSLDHVMDAILHETKNSPSESDALNDLSTKKKKQKTNQSAYSSSSSSVESSDTYGHSHSNEDSDELTDHAEDFESAFQEDEDEDEMQNNEYEEETAAMEKSRYDKEEDEEDAKYTYKPLPGTDIYGRSTDSSTLNQESKINKYIPPHLRQQHRDTSSCLDKLDDDGAKLKFPTTQSTKQESIHTDEALTILRRQLNNQLNRLSNNTLESVIQAITSLYTSFPCQEINSLLYEIIQQICIAPHLIMTNLIPIYMACIAGIHFYQKNASVSLHCGTHVVETGVLRLLDELHHGRTCKSTSNNHNQNHQKSDDILETTDNKLAQNDNDGDHSSLGYNKNGPNLILILCYLYNFNVIHCTLLYDIIRYDIAILYVKNDLYSSLIQPFIDSLVI